MLSSSSSQLQKLQQKVVHLQADNMIYQDQISRLRKRIIQLQQYRIKYQLLLQKQNQQSPLHRSRRVDQINNMNKKIQQNNDKWNIKIKLLQTKYQKMVHQLQDKNYQLMRQLQTHKQLLSQKSKSSNIISQLQYSKLKQQLNSYKSKTSQLTSQLLVLKSSHTQLQQQYNKLKIRQQSLNNLQSQLEQKLLQTRYQQKEFYRNNILQLQNKIKLLQEEVEYHRIRASPERQAQIKRLQEQVRNRQIINDQDASRFNLLIQSKNNQIQQLQQTLQLSKSQSYNYTQTLQSQLQQLSQRLSNSQQQHHAQLIVCRQQMQQLRLKQNQLLKQSFSQLQDSHQKQRQQWKLILKQQQQQLQRIKITWQQQKQRWNQQKNKLKNKINQLKQKQKLTAQQQKANVDNQTFKLIASLKVIDQQQNKYNDYQSNVTFLIRQLKRATHKIQQKQRQVSKILNQLKTQRQQFQNQTQFIKKIQRQQVHYYKQKLTQADQLNSKLLTQLREKDNYIRDRDAEHKLIHQKLSDQNQQLHDLIKQMQSHYNRLTDNKKNLYQDYRSQRDLVFTGKAQLSQQRKNKWIHLDRQKNQLQIAYKERQKQIRTQFQLQINQLKQQINKLNLFKQQASAQNHILKQRVKQATGKSVSNKQNQQNLKQFHKKLATLDVQISLTQNLFSTIKSVRQRQTSNSRKRQLFGQQRSQLDQMSVHESQQSAQSRQLRDQKQMSLNQNQLQRNNVAPTFARRVSQQRKYSQQYENFSFRPQQPSIRITKPKQGQSDDMSFNPKRAEDNSSSPGWGL